MRRISALLFILAFLACLFAPTIADAHGMRTAYVELRELDQGVVSVLVRSGAVHGGVRVVMPPSCAPVAATSSFECTTPLAGSEVAVEGLGAVVSDAVVTAVLLDGGRPSRLLRPGSSRWTIPGRSSSIDSAGRYVRAGAVHVLSGADHLLFLVALVVLLRRFRAVLVAETAFTFSHVVTMSATALGVLRVPPAAAEAAIALSLVYVALDIGDRRRTRPSPRSGALMALAFGAVHGLGFASGLQEMGASRDTIVPALFGFAVGIEAAQVLFLLACFAAHAAISKTRFHRVLATATAYGVGVTGFFWLVDRALPIVRGALL